jgi:hypothetical protein
MIAIKAFFKNNQFVLLLFFIALLTFPLVRTWMINPFTSDAAQYHSYLVALFIQHDLSFSFDSGYWTQMGPIGNPIQKMSIGVALFQLPFFLIGHLIAHLTSFEVNGVSQPYAFSIAVGTVMYVVIGIHFLKRILSLFYSVKAVNFSLILLFFATNLWFYTVSWGLLSHSYLFFGLSMVVYHTVMWHQNHQSKHLFGLAFFGGLLTVTRPTEIIFILFPLLYGVHKLSDLKTKFIVLIQNKFTLIASVGLFLLPIFPQLLYWKIYAGSWLYYSYTDERFFFTDPKIIEVLFSSRKGLLIYTPILTFAFIGFYHIKNKPFFKAGFLYFIINVFIISSWWCWWYGGGYGMRALVQTYAILVFPLTAFFDAVLNTIQRKSFLISSIYIIFIGLNTVNIVLYSRGILHWDSLTFKAYYKTFPHITLSKETPKEYLEYLNEPNYEAAKLGFRSEEEMRLYKSPK